MADDALQAIDELDSALFSNPVRLTFLIVIGSYSVQQRCVSIGCFFPIQLDSDSASNLAQSHSTATEEDVEEVTAL